MTDYLKIFNEELKSGLPAKVEGPGTEDWYTRGIPQPGQADYRVENQPEQGAMPARDAGPQFPWQTPGQPAPAPPSGPAGQVPQAGQVPVQPVQPPQQIDYGKIFEQELYRPDESALSNSENERVRNVIDQFLRGGQRAQNPGTKILNEAIKKITGVDLYASQRSAIRNVSGNLLKSIDMQLDIMDERFIERSLEKWDTDEDFQQALRIPEDPDAVPILTRSQFEKHLEKRREPGKLDDIIDRKLFEETAEEQLRKLDHNFAQTLIEDVARTGQEMMPQVLAFMLGKKLTGSQTGGRLLSSLWMGTQIAGPIYQQKVEEGMSPKQAYKQAIASAAGQSVLESIGLGKIMNAGGMGKGLLKKFIAGGLAEGATEWLQEYWDLAMDIWYDDPRREEIFESLQSAWDKGENPFTKEGELYEKLREDIWEATKTGAYSALVALPLGGIGGAMSPDVKSKKDQKEAEITDEQLDLINKGELKIDQVLGKDAKPEDMAALVDRLYQRSQQETPTVVNEPMPEQTPEEFFDMPTEEETYWEGLDEVINEELPKAGPATVEQPVTEQEKARYRELKAKKTPTVPEAVERQKLRKRIADEVRSKGFFDVSQSIDFAIETEAVGIRTPAIRYRGKVYEGNNHAEAYQKLVDDIGGEVPDADFIDGKLEDGFVATNDEFVDRDTGFGLAREAGQIKEGYDERGYLVSEALKESEVKQEVEIGKVKEADLPPVLDLNDEAVDDALMQTEKMNIIQTAHPHLEVPVYQLKDGRMMVDQPLHGVRIFPAEFDTVRWVKNLTTNIDGTEIEVKQQVAPKAKKAPAKKAKTPPPLPKKAEPKGKVTPPPLPKEQLTKSETKLIEKIYDSVPELHGPVTDIQKMIESVAAVFGRKRRLFFFKPNKKSMRVRGFHVGSKIFISDTTDPAWHTFGHESLHDLKTNRYDLYLKLKEVVEAEVNKEIFAAYMNDLNAARAEMKDSDGKPLPPLDYDAALEEYIAEYVGIQVRESTFWRKIFKKSRELFDRLATNVMKLIDVSGEHWLDKYKDHMFADADRVRSSIADVMLDYWSDAGIQAKPGKKLGVVEAAKVGYAVEQVQQNLDPKMVKSLTENKVLTKESLEVFDALGEAGALDDMLTAQLADQKYFTDEFYNKALKKFEQAKVDLRKKLKGTFVNDKGNKVKIDQAKYDEGLAKAQAEWDYAQERHTRSMKMSRSEVRKKMTRDERPSFMNITIALKNNKKLRKMVDALNKRLGEISPGASLFEEDGSFKHHPIEERTKPDADKVFEVLPKFGGFRRNISQTFVENIDEVRREKFRKEIVSWVEEAHRKKIEPQLFGQNLINSTSKQYPLALAVRKAHKTLGAINLNAICPMFNIGNHGCYLDGCYLTAMGAGGNGVNFYRTALYMGEILQLKDEEIKALNKVGGLRMNGVGDTDVMHMPQYADVFKHAQMRGLKIKIISKQPVVFKIISDLQKSSDKDVAKMAKSVIVQPTVDPYWIPITEDDFPGAGANVMGLIQTARKKGASPALAAKFKELLGREARVINGQLYRKYGFSWDQLSEMSKKYPTVKTAPRLVVGTFKEIAQYALETPGIIQTWMHAAVRPGMYSEVNGRVLGEGEIGNFTKRVLMTFDKGDFRVKATNKDGIISKQAKTYEALENYIKEKYTPKQQQKIFTTLWGQNKKDPSALCCRAGANEDACMDCSSHCHNGTSYTGTKLGKISDKGASQAVFPEDPVDIEVKQELEPSLRSELPEDFDNHMRDKGVKISKLGVGKDIGGAVHIHRMYENLIPDVQIAKEKLPDDFDYTTIKWNYTNGSITFSKVADFDTAEEPHLGDQFLVKEDGSTRYMKAHQDPWIYHHKWTMVGEDYKGFDVKESKLRSLQWTSLDNVDTARIGKWSFWQENIIPRLGEVAADSSRTQPATSDALKKQASSEFLKGLGWEPWMQMYTQIPSTKPTYDKVAAWLKKKGIKGDRTLDYSAGLGHGAKKMKAKSFEPFPQKGFDPTWTDPKDIDQKFDAIVNNAVLNVIPGDTRAGVIDHIGSVIDTDGFALIMARSRSELMGGKVKNPVWINEKTGEVLTSWRKRKHPETGESVDITTYQKGYAGPRELGEEIVGQLGREYTWIPAPKELGLSTPAVLIKRRGPEVSQQIDMGSVWYSQMENVLRGKLQSGPPKQVKSNLQQWAKKGMFKQEELDYSGVLDWLDEQTGKVQPDEVMDYLAENHVEIGEKILSDMGEFENLWSKKEFADEYLRTAEKWVTEDVGADVWAEVPEHVEQAMIDYGYDQSLEAKEIIDDWLDGWDISPHDLNVETEANLEYKGGKTKYGSYTYPDGKAKNYRELLIQLPKNKGLYYAKRHWGDIPNILAHVRFNERPGDQGKKVLFIEEIQSDWHQEGRKKGYGQSKRSQLAEKYQTLVERAREQDLGVNVEWIRNNADKATELQMRILRAYDAQEALADTESAYEEGVADAPFKKTWKLLALKRMVKWAADNGFDAIGWTSGQIQADRYDLSKHYKSIEYTKVGEDGYKLIGTTIDNSTIDITRNQTIAPEDVEEHVGKELADKILAGENQKGTRNGNPVGEFSGVDLKVGGEGMMEFYDKILKNDFNNFFNKSTWGKMKVEKKLLEWIDEGEFKIVEDPKSFPDYPYATAYKDKEGSGPDTGDGDWVEEFGFNSRREAEEHIKETKAGDKTGAVDYWHADLTQETKSKASMEPMVMFDLDIGTDIDPETEALLNEKVGRQPRTMKEKIVSSLDEFWKNRTTRLVDRLHPIKEKLGGEAAPYMLHRGLPGVQSVLNALMAHGKLIWDASKAITTKQRHKGFLPWVKSLGADSEKAFYWIMVKRAEVLEGEGREQWLTEDVRDQILKWIGEPAGEKSWQNINDEFQEWNQNVLDIAVESGLLSKEQIKDWQREFYIPFYRVLEDEQARLEYLKGPAKGRENLSARVRRLKGADTRLGDPFENILRNWSHLIGESMANTARGEAYGYAMDNKVMSGLTRIDEDGNEVPVPLLEQVGWADTVVFKPAGKGATFVHKKTGDEILSFKRDGETVFFRVNDPELFQALSLVNREYVDNILMKALTGSKRALTYGATFGPAFRIANLIRDTLHTFQITEGWSFKPFVSTAKGFWQAWREDPEFVEFMASGHAFGGSYVRADNPKALEKYIRKAAQADGISRKKVMDRILDTPKKMLGFWERVGEASENAARVALYTSLKKEGKTHLEAAFAARDLMDFQMSGNSNVVGFLIQTVPFLNARAQGLYRMGRAAMENPKTFFFKGAMIWAATMALWLNNRDDERYKALEDWDKFSYYHFWIGDKHYRIPKPFETGVVFSTAWEAMADTSTGNEEAEHMWTFTKHALGETFAFNPIPQGVRPLAEQWANKSFFTGRPIESQFQQKLKPGERYDPWTSETLILAGKLGIPPKRAEALIRGYFSDVGMGLLAASDLAARTFADFPERPAKRIDEYPMIGRFVKEAAPARNVKYMTKFWDSMGELDKLTNTVNMYKNSGDLEGAMRIGEANRKLLQMQKGLNKQRQRIRKISYEVKRIWNDPNLDGEQKRQMIDQLTAERNRLVETIYKQYLKEI